jgi:hypothetical protein
LGKDLPYVVCLHHRIRSYFILVLRFPERNPVERLIEHNGNHHHFTAHQGTWKLIFFRNFEHKIDALKFEKKLKSPRNFLKIKKGPE